MIFGDFVGLNLPDICLTGEGKPRKPNRNLTSPLYVFLLDSRLLGLIEP